MCARNLDCLERMTPIAQRLGRAGGALLAIVAIVFLAEMGAMGVLALFGLVPFDVGAAVVDGLVLSLLAAGPVYWLMLLPIHREHDKRLEAEKRARELDRLAMTDPLTGVLNRRGILVRMLQAMAHAERYERHLAVSMLDLDRFKAVNDEHGHAFGDQVLKAFVARVVPMLRASDLIGRMGGDEFLIVLPETELELAAVLAERVRDQIDAEPFEIAGTTVPLSVSIGASEFDKGERLGDLLDRVDRALYRAKASGRRAGNGAVSAFPVAQPPASSPAATT